MITLYKIFLLYVRTSAFAQFLTIFEAGFAGVLMYDGESCVKKRTKFCKCGGSNPVYLKKERGAHHQHRELL